MTAPRCCPSVVSWDISGRASGPNTFTMSTLACSHATTCGPASASFPNLTRGCHALGAETMQLGGQLHDQAPGQGIKGDQTLSCWPCWYVVLCHHLYGSFTISCKSSSKTIQHACPGVRLLHDSPGCTHSCLALHLCMCIAHIAQITYMCNAHSVNMWNMCLPARMLQPQLHVALLAFMAM